MSIIRIILDVVIGAPLVIAAGVVAVAQLIGPVERPAHYLRGKGSQNYLHSDNGVEYLKIYDFSGRMRSSHR